MLSSPVQEIPLTEITIVQLRASKSLKRNAWSAAGEGRVALFWSALFWHGYESSELDPNIHFLPTHLSHSKHIPDCIPHKPCMHRPMSFTTLEPGRWISMSRGLTDLVPRNVAGLLFSGGCNLGKPAPPNLAIRATTIQEKWSGNLLVFPSRSFHFFGKFPIILSCLVCDSAVV